MYPAYPLIALAGAVSLSAMDDAVSWWLAADAKKELSRPVSIIITLFSYCRKVLLLLIMALSISRSFSMVTGFGAPLRIYSQLYNVELEALSAVEPRPQINSETPSKELKVCVGKEWHRFPAWFFLPRGSGLAFVRGGFDGQLPQRFSSEHGTWGTPSGFNGDNKEDPTRYVDSKVCDYYVDLELQGVVDPRFSVENGYKLILEEPFLDLERSPQLTRAFFIPLLSRARNAYARYAVRKKV